MFYRQKERTAETKTRLIALFLYDKLFLRYARPTKDAWPYFQLGPLSETLTITNLLHSAWLNKFLQW